MPHGVYATAWECMSFLDIQDRQTFLITDRRFIDFTLEMATLFDTFAKRWFLPVRETRYYDHPDDSSFQVAVGSGYSTALPNILELDADLLALLTLKTNNGERTITADNYFLRTGYSYNFYPKDSIELKIDGTQTTFLYSGTPQQANSVEGIYGYHEKYSEAWASLDTVQDAGGIDAVTTTITVVDADAFDEVGQKPRFQEQQLLRLGTTDTAEMVYVVGVNYSANTLQVVRGVNGSTAAVAAASSTIQVYRPMRDLRNAMKILTAKQYRRKDSINSGTDGKMMTATGMLIIPEQLPSEVADMIKAYKYAGPPRGGTKRWL